MAIFNSKLLVYQRVFMVIRSGNETWLAGKSPIKQYANSFKRIWEDGSTAKLWQSYVTNLPGPLRTRSTKQRRHFFPSTLNKKNSSSSQSSQLFSTIIPSLSPTFSIFLENLHLCQALMNELVVPSEEHGRSFYAPAPKAAEKAEEVEAWSWMGWVCWSTHFVRKMEKAKK